MLSGEELVRQVALFRSERRRAAGDAENQRRDRPEDLGVRRDDQPRHEATEREPADERAVLLGGQPAQDLARRLGILIPRRDRAALGSGRGLAGYGDFAVDHQVGRGAPSDPIALGPAPQKFVVAIVLVVAFEKLREVILAVDRRRLQRHRLQCRFPRLIDEIDERHRQNDDGRDQSHSQDHLRDAAEREDPADRDAHRADRRPGQSAARQGGAVESPGERLQSHHWQNHEPARAGVPCTLGRMFTRWFRTRPMFTHDRQLPGPATTGPARPPRLR